ncbi:MAG: AsmA family protein [Xanthobacteraceae bacterium]
MKALKILGVVLFLSIAAIGVLLAVGLPSGLVTGSIEKRIEEATGYQIDIDGGATVRLWPLTTVTLRDVRLYDPKDRVLSQRLSAESIRAELSLRGLLTGAPRVRELNIVKPVVTLPMSRERVRADNVFPGQADLVLGPDHRPFALDRIVVSDATVIFKDPRHQAESRIDQLNVKGLASPGRKLDVTLDGRAGEQMFKAEAKATIPSGPLDRLTVPVEFKLDAVGLLPQAVSGTGEVKLTGSTISINSLTGMLGQALFSGYASVEATAKPFVKLDLDFKKLNLETPASLDSTKAPTRSADASWNNEPIKLDGLNYIDADIKISASELNIGSMNLAPAKIEGTIAAGVVRAAVSEVGLYEGQAALGLAIDASIATPIYALRADLRDVRALPLLSHAADFSWLDGKMQAQFDIRATGKTQRELAASLSGTANVDFRDGQIRGLNVAQMIRSLTSTTLNGWQDDSTQATDLSELHAAFRIENGKATTADLRLAGPLVRVGGSGSIDLTMKTLAFKLEPKLVMTTQGQGSTVADPLGLGVPVTLEGPWSAPRIYPDMAGILDNPDAAFAKLREMGQGLFGQGGLFGGSGKDAQGKDGNKDGGGKLIEGIGSLIQGLTKPAATGAAGDSAGQGVAPPAQAQAQTPAQAQAPAQGQQPAQPNAAPGNNEATSAKQIDSIIRQLFGR